MNVKCSVLTRIRKQGIEVIHLGVKAARDWKHWKKRDGLSAGEILTYGYTSRVHSSWLVTRRETVCFGDKSGWTFGLPRIASWPRASVPFPLLEIESIDGLFPITSFQRLLCFHLILRSRKGSRVSQTSLDDEATNGVKVCSNPFHHEERSGSTPNTG